MMPKMIAMLSLDRYTHNTCHTTTFNRFQAKISILGDYFAQNIIKSALNDQIWITTVSLKRYISKNIVPMRARALLQVTFSSATFF